MENQFCLETLKINPRFTQCATLFIVRLKVSWLYAFNISHVAIIVSSASETAGILQCAGYSLYVLEIRNHFPTTIYLSALASNDLRSLGSLNINSSMLFVQLVFYCNKNYHSVPHTLRLLCFGLTFVACLACWLFAPIIYPTILLSNLGQRFQVC